MTTVPVPVPVPVPASAPTRRTALATIVCVLAGALPLGGCGGASPADAAAPRQGLLRGKLTVTGSSTAAPLVAEIARRFEALHPGVRVDVQTGGSSRGIADAIAGLADVGMSSRGLHPSEHAALASHVLARDGVCFIVHARNPVTHVSDVALRSIFSGALDTWAALGGPDRPITVIARPAGRSEHDLVTAYLGLDAAALKPDAVAGENQQGIRQVATDPDAIAPMSVGTAEMEARRGIPIRLLPLRGVEASSHAVASGGYPLARPLLLVARPEPGSLARAFLEYALGPDVQDLIEEHALVPPG
jgi:phosphate transport system substrate-binding protein